MAKLDETSFKAIEDCMRFADCDLVLTHQKTMFLKNTSSSWKTIQLETTRDRHHWIPLNCMLDRHLWIPLI